MSLGGAACDGTDLPSIELGDGGVDTVPESDAGTLPYLDPLAVPPPDPRFGAILPAYAWTSPAQCPAPTDTTYCATCWSWTDGGPWSIDRNTSGDRFGTVASGDFNGDGYPDLAVGAPGDDGASESGAGRIDIFLGTERGYQPWQTFTPEELDTQESAGLGMGIALAAGDFNDDGYSDLAVAFESVPASGARIVVAYGASDGWSDRIAYELGDIDPSSSTETIPLGHSMTVGDFSNDGIDDLAVGAEEYDLSGQADAGAVFVLYGDTGSGLAAGVRVDLNDGAIGALADDRFGNSLATFEQAGADLLVIGMHGYGWVLTYEDGSYAGPWYSNYGLPNFGERVAVGDLDGDYYADIIVSGSSGDFVEVLGTYNTIASKDERGSREFFPLAVADMNLDGAQDVVFVSVPPTGDAYAALVYAGDGSLWPSNAFELGYGSSREPNDQLGLYGFVEDINGDLYPDLVLGAPASSTPNATGRVHVWTASDPDVWWNVPDPTQVVDQELPLDCDACAVHLWSDGTICDAGTGDEICVDTTCVTRECGDGYRQTGAEGHGWSREECDDHNYDGGDLCGDCVSYPYALAATADGRDAPFGPRYTAGVDGTGAVLVIWRSETTSGWVIRGQRFTRYGAPDGGELTLSDPFGIGIAADPSVAGLAGGGWVITWSQPDGDGDMAGVLLRIVQPDGALGSLLVGPQETYLDQTEPSVAAVGTGFALAWTDSSQSLSGGPARRVCARGFDATGVPMFDDLLVSSEPTREHAEPVVAVSGNTVLVAWVDRGGDVSDPTEIRARRLGSTGPLDAADILVADNFASEVAVATLASGDFVAVWRDGSTDAWGDIVGRRIAATGTPLVEPPEVLVSNAGSSGPFTSDFAPSVAPLSGDDYFVVHQVYRSERGLGMAFSAGATAPSEIATLEWMFSDDTAGDGAVVTSPRGVWTMWSSGADPSAVGARRMMAIFLMAVD